MLAELMNKLYHNLRISLYMQIFAGAEESKNKKDSLTTVESFAMECIAALDNPTVSEFAAAMNISSPNAAYKIGSLLKKGFLKKIQSEHDRREYHLQPTEKYYEYMGAGKAYIEAIVKNCEEKFSADEIRLLESLLQVINTELMPDSGIENVRPD